MALTKITSAIIADGAITASAITNTSITADKLHTTLDLTGKAVTVATATAGDNDTTAASTAFVSTAIANLADSAPSTLNTLNELAAALGDDANFSTTVTNSIALKAPLASPTFTGNAVIDGTLSVSTVVKLGTRSQDGQTNAFIGFDRGSSDVGLGFGHASGTGRVYYPCRDDGSGVSDVIGLGTSTYKYKDLHLSGIASIGNLKIGTDQGSDGQVLTSTGSGVAWEDAAGGGVAGITSSANATAITIDSSENVGIGTSSPYSKLNVQGTSASTYTGGGPGATIRASQSTDGNWIASDVDGKFAYFGVDGNDAKYAAYNYASNAEMGIVLGQSRMYIKNNGNVGIGTTTPVAPLTINDKATFSFNSSDFALGHQLYYDGGDDRWERLTGNAGSAIYQTAGNILFYRTAAGGATGDAVTPTESMRITSAGNVGIGTNSPSTELHIKSTDANALTVETDTAINQIHLSNSTNSPTYLTQDSYGFQIKADENGWGGTNSFFSVKVKAGEKLRIAHDGETTITGTKMNVISSAEAVMGAQATGNSYWRVVADNSPNTYFQAGTGQSSSQVKMYFTGMYGSNNTMTVDTPNSRVGIGTTSPGKKLDVRGTVRALGGSSYNDISLSDELPGYGTQSYGNIKASGNNVYFSIGSSYVSYIAPNGSYNVSDLRLKENITDLSDSLDKILQLRGVNYTWKDTENRGAETHIGFIAQEVEEVLPELVGDGGLPIDEDGNEAYKNVNYANLVPVLVEAIKELKAENDALKARLDAGGL